MSHLITERNSLKYFFLRDKSEKKDFNFGRSMIYLNKILLNSYDFTNHDNLNYNCN